MDLESLSFFQDLPSNLKVFFMSMIPVLELRASIPWALAHYKDLSHMEIMFWACSGNICPNFFILWALPKITKFTRNHWEFADKKLAKLFEKTRSEHSKKFKTFGALAIVLFVGTPIPGSGSWTGSLVAWLFGVKYWKAVMLISTGVIIAGVAVFSLSVGIAKIWHVFHF